METHLPPKKKKVLLGVGDPKIGAAIQEELGYNCQTGGVIAEILRGETVLKSGGRGGSGNTAGCFLEALLLVWCLCVQELAQSLSLLTVSPSSRSSSALPQPGERSDRFVCL